VERLQDAATRDAQQRSARERAVEAMRERALAHLGEFELLEGGGVRSQLRPRAGLDVEAAQALERALQAGAATPVRVVPALQALPPLVFADDSTELDATAKARVDAIAWALARLGIDAVRVTGHGGDARTARARAEAVADALGGRVRIELEVATVVQVREAAAASGRAAVRSVRIEPLAL
jgi:outer membrane protein OmpA-like peptidoglycan-associated protein